MSSIVCPRSYGGLWEIGCGLKEKNIINQAPHGSEKGRVPLHVWLRLTDARRARVTATARVSSMDGFCGHCGQNAIPIRGHDAGAGQPNVEVG